MAAVGPDGDGSPPASPAENSERPTNRIGDILRGVEANSPTESNNVAECEEKFPQVETTLSTNPRPVRRIIQEEGHRQCRSDTLESFDGDIYTEHNNRGRRRTNLKTFEQLRSMHPETSYYNADGHQDTLERRGGLMPSISRDIQRYAKNLRVATISRIRRRRELGALPSFSCRAWLNKLPFLDTFKNYKREYFPSDFAAGLAEGIVCIPMGMSYALLANLPPVYGLYTSLVPPFMYLLFGTCHQLSLGVSAIESLLVSAGVSQIIGWVGDEVNATTTQEDIDVKVQVTIAFTLCVGFWHMIMRIFGVGAIATFLSDPVLSGFSTASAFLIGTSQLKHLVGYELPTAILPVTWYEAVTNVHNFNLTAVLVGCSGIFILWVFKKLNQRYLPSLPLPSQGYKIVRRLIGRGVVASLTLKVVVVTLATMATYLFQWEDAPYNLKVLGVIPEGLPSPSIPTFPKVDGVGGLSSYGTNMAIQSLLVAVMTYIITISIGKTFSRINNNSYKILGDQELIAMSSANIVGSIFKTYPASGSLSRTAVVQSIMAKTRMHAIPSLFVVMLVLVAITPLLYTLPKTILASVVMFGVVKMVDFRDAKRLYHLSKPDFFLWNISFWVTIIVGPIEGIAVSLAVSLLYLLMQASRPANSILGRLPETREYRNIKRFPMAKEIPGIRIFRFDSSLHFANKDYFENRLKALEQDPCEGVPIHTIVLDASSINQLDASAIEMLILVAKSYGQRGVSILCANWKGPQRDLLELSGFYDVIHPRNLFLGLHDAVVEARKRTQDGSNELQPSAPESPSSVVCSEGGPVNAKEGSRDPETVVEIGPDGGTREWRVGAMEITSSGDVEREWGLGRV